MRSYLAVLTLFAVGLGCSPAPQVGSGTALSEWGACLTRADTGDFTLHRALFPAHDVGRIDANALVRFSAVGDSYSVWQTVSRLAEAGGARWRFIADHSEADILFASIDGEGTLALGELKTALTVFSLDNQVHGLILNAVAASKANTVMYFGVGTEHGQRKIIVTREPHRYTNRVGVHSFAAIAAVGGERDFEVLRACRGDLIAPSTLPPRPTDEARALFSAMLTL